ncbi:MAG: 16S rRNA processing protein RimM [Chitinophagaceae bacterium]|jgi:16S rRNA processing protein RimM|nr:16S rRNA processing protein RimM [Chitinophagaceae bacterium]
MEDKICIGTLVATHGLDGTLILRHALGGRTDFPGVSVFFVETSREELLPYFPAELRARNTSETFLRLDGVHTPERARGLLKKRVWLPASEARRLTARNAPISLLGYMVETEGKDLCKVLEVIEQPHQILLRGEVEGKEVLLPLNESTLVEIDHEALKVVLDLPDGLLDVYLS